MRPLTNRADRRLTGIFAVAAALLSVLLTVTPVAAAPTDILLASATGGQTLKLGDVAAANAIGVVFQQGRHSFLRWSTDGGATFAPKWALRGGWRAKDPRLAACGDLLWATSVWQSDVARNVGVDYRDTSLGTTGRFALGPGFIPDIACFGEYIAVTWADEGLVKLAILDGPCANPCVPAYQADLGSGGEEGFGPRIAAAGDSFVVAWLPNGLSTQRFQVSGSGVGLIVTPYPMTTIMVGKNISTPEIAGDGARVVVAYSHGSETQIGTQTHMRISEDHALTFGPRIVVSNYCRGCEGGSWPDSADALDGRILVGVVKAGGIPPDIGQGGFLTKNDGQRWKKTPTHRGGFQIGVLASDFLYEAWDSHFYVGWPYAPYPQEIWFHKIALT